MTNQMGDLKIGETTTPCMGRGGRAFFSSFSFFFFCLFWLFLWRFKLLFIQAVAKLEQKSPGNQSRTTANA
jgi:hypothetical protein